jgi:hypothetical protein
MAIETRGMTPLLQVFDMQSSLHFIAACSDLS